MKEPERIQALQDLSAERDDIASEKKKKSLFRSGPVAGGVNAENLIQRGKPKKPDGDSNRGEADE